MFVFFIEINFFLNCFIEKILINEKKYFSILIKLYCETINDGEMTNSIRHLKELSNYFVKSDPYWPYQTLAKNIFRVRWYSKLLLSFLYCLCEL